MGNENGTAHHKAHDNDANRSEFYWDDEWPLMADVFAGTAATNYLMIIE